MEPSLAKVGTMIVRGTLARHMPEGALFVETGTREGDRVAWALELGASQIWSIENREDRWKAAVERFKENKNVTIHHGHSPDVLKGWIMPKLMVPAVFWIDAHTGKESPILDELKEINGHIIKDHTLIIDDVRLMKKGDWGISLGQVIDRVMAINPSYTLSFEDGFIPGDILVAKTLHG